jgi:hypothetical protein
MIGKSGKASFLALIFALTLFSPSISGAQTQGPSSTRRRLITQSIDEGNLVTLTGNTRPEATAANDLGPVGSAFVLDHMLLQLRRPPETEQALEEFIDQLHESRSPNFRRWLSAAEFGDRFGPSQEDVATITNWLQSHGFRVNAVYPSRMVIDFSGNAGQVKEAFRTEMHVLGVKLEAHVANMSDPQIPAALAPAVAGVVSLNDFRPHPAHEMRPSYTLGNGSHAVVPSDLATIYNFNPLFSGGYSGQGQTIVVIEDTDVFATSDWTTFRSTFGLSSYTSGSFTEVHPAPPSGTNNCTDPGVVGGSFGAEAILDAEYSSAAAPSAAIELASCKDSSTTFGGLIALQNLLNKSTSPPAIVSISYGECEAALGATANAAFSAAYQQGVTEGVSIFVSAGDSGAAMCDSGAAYTTHGIGVSGFASTPYNVAVGGTDFADDYFKDTSTYWGSTNNSFYGSALSYIPEIPWNFSCASELKASSSGDPVYGSGSLCNADLLLSQAGGGGPSGCATGKPSTIDVVSGTCAGYPKPSWQSVLGNPSDGVRDLPDVSLFSSDAAWNEIYIFCWSDTSNGGSPCTGAPSGWSEAGGTSFASPIMAGIQALINQNTSSRWGNPNYLYYGAARSEYGTSGGGSCQSGLGNGVSSSCIFYDVTLGDIDLACTGTNNCYLPSGTYGVLSTSETLYDPAYAASTGWDFATGIGSVNATNLVDFAAATTSGTGTFAYTGNLNTARWGHTATPLSNGMVLVAGGLGVRYVYLASAELYNPSTGGFGITGSLNTARNGHTATLLNNGMVLITGGDSSNGVATSSCELYNPSTGTFSTTGSLHAARAGHTATLLSDGMVLVAGGETAAGALSSAELYNPSTGTFTTTGSLHTARDDHTATLLNNGMVLVAAGIDNSTLLSSAELYNPSTGTFSVTGSLHTVRYDHTATLLSNGLLLVAGGTGNTYLTSAELYNPSTGTFSITGSLNTARYDHTATLLDNGIMVLITGGGNASSVALSSAEIYNVLTGTFSFTGSLNTGRTLHTATLLNTGTVLITAGEGSSSTFLSSAELYQ